MRAHFLSVRSISGDSVASYRLRLFTFKVQVVPLPLQLGFQDPLRFYLRDCTIFPVHPMLLLHGLLGPPLRVLPMLRCISSLALRHVRFVRHSASPLHVAGALVECGGFSSMAGANLMWLLTLGPRFGFLLIFRPIQFVFSKLLPPRALSSPHNLRRRMATLRRRRARRRRRCYNARRHNIISRHLELLGVVNI